MSQNLGKLITCDRCGRIIFLKYTGLKDCGFRDQDEFESVPREWMHQEQFGDLCPSCAKEFQIFCRDFFPSVAASWTFALDYEEGK